MKRRTARSCSSSGSTQSVVTFASRIALTM